MLQRYSWFALLQVGSLLILLTYYQSLSPSRLSKLSFLASVCWPIFPVFWLEEVGTKNRKDSSRSSSLSGTGCWLYWPFLLGLWVWSKSHLTTKEMSLILDFSEGKRLIIGFCTGAAIAQHHGLSGLNNRNLVFPISRGWYPGVRRVDFFGGLSPWLANGLLCLYLHMLFPLCIPVPISPS